MPYAPTIVTLYPILVSSLVTARLSVIVLVPPLLEKLFETNQSELIGLPGSPIDRSTHVTVKGPSPLTPILNDTPLVAPTYGNMFTGCVVIRGDTLRRTTGVLITSVCDVL